MKLKNLLVTAAAAAMCALPLPSWAQAAAVEAGRTDCGVLYIEPDSVSAVKKDGQYYLIFTAEEKYTDQEFLASLRQEEEMQQAAAAVYLYMFNSFGSEYCLGAHYIIDTGGKVCLDLGSNLAMQPVGDDKTLKNAYTLALKVWERKNRKL